MDILNGIILGIVQGLTEFLPISSSGHLIIARDILGVADQNGLSFDAVLQLATSLAVLIYFRKTIWDLFVSLVLWIAGKGIEKKQKTLILALSIGTIPAVVIGIFIESYMDTIFRNILLVAIAMLVGSAVMWIAERFGKISGEHTLKKGFLIGLFQCLALVPGMSRSGMTISGGLLLGLGREESARFAFLLSFPILFGSGLKKFFEISHGGALLDLGASLLAGSVSAFIVGIIVIHYLLKYLRKHTLYVFIWYRLILAFAIILFSFV